MTQSSVQDPAAMSEMIWACGAVFADADWRTAWRGATVETIVRDSVLTARDRTGAETGIPLYDIGDSALWRGYEHDAGMRDVLPMPVSSLSSLYAISSPINRLGAAEAIAVVDQALDHSERCGSRVLLVTNLEGGAALRELRVRRPPGAEVRLDATCRAPVPESVDEFVKSLSKSARSDVRRRHRRATEKGVEFVQRWGEHAASALAEFLMLTVQSADQHGNPPLYDLPTLRAIMTIPGAMLLTAEHDGKILAGSVSFVRGDCLLVWSAGVNYSTLHTHHSYVFLLRETVELAVRRGCRWMDFGRGTFEFKRRHGFSSNNLYTLAYPIGDGAGQDQLIRRVRDMDVRIAELLGF